MFIRILPRTLFLGATAALMLLAQVASAFTYFPASPRGTVGLSRAVIGQRLKLAPGEQITGAQMWLDGVAVTPSLDADGLVSYTPPLPLSAGRHQVRLSVSVSAGQSDYFYEPLVSEFSFVVADGAVNQLPVPGPEELRALSWVNRQRATAKLGAMSYDPALGASAAGHARFLAANPAQASADAHGEEPGLPGFTGAGPGDRAAYWTYGAGVAEVINFTPRAEEAVDGWLETLYHRIPLIHPGNKTMGYGLAAGGGKFFDVLEAGPGDESPGTVLWPPAGQTDVPTGWHGGEVPDPFRLYPGAAKPVGYTITATFGGDVRSLVLTAATLTGPAGEVPVMRFSPEMDNHLTDTVAMIPRSPLAPGATYTASVAGTVDLGGGPQPFEKRWTFTTSAAAALAVKNWRVSYAAGGPVARISLTGSGFAPGIRVFLGGLPAEGLEVQSDTQLSFPPPSGFDGSNSDLLAVSPTGAEEAWNSAFASRDFTFPQPGDVFVNRPVAVEGKELGANARLHPGGGVLVPEEVLAELGAEPVRLSATGRTYWTLGGRTGDYTLGRTAAAVGEQALRLDLPVQKRSGRTYVEARFVRELAGVAMRINADQVLLGTPVEGMLDVARHWARDPVAELLRAGIVSGNGDATFRPDATLTRAAFVKMLAGARGLKPVPGAAGGFGDTAEHWVARQGYIGAAVQAGVVKPGEYDGGRFEPDLPIRREEIAVMVARALGREAQAASRLISLVGGETVIAGRRFTDAGEWIRPGYVAEAVELSIITGYAETGGGYTFRPARLATRAEAAAMTLRAMQK